MSEVIVVELKQLKQFIKETISECLAQHRHETLEEYIKIEEVCELLQVTRPTVHLWKKEGKLPFYKIGNRLFFKKSEVLGSPLASKKVG